MREYLLVVVVAAAVTFLTTPLVRALAVVTGAFTPLRARDVHDTPIPRLGGVAMFLGFAAAAVVARELPFLSQTYSSGQISGVLLGAGIMCLVGAVDDVHELDWLTKLAGQVLAAGIMAYKGVSLLAVPFFGTQTVLPTPVLVAVTVFIVLVTVNAVNWIDGLDGLAAGTVAIAALAFFGYAYLVSRSYNPPNVFTNATFFTAALFGVCLGFLPHNFHPARLFMGDSGALMLGLLLAAATISMTSNVDPSQFTGGQVTAAILPLAVPLAVLSVPFVDVVLAVVRRTRAGQKPWQADAKHLHHRMLELGHGHRNAVLVLYLWGAVLSLGTVAFAVVDAWRAGIGLAVGVLVALGVTVGLPRWSAPRRL